MSRSVIYLSLSIFLALGGCAADIDGEDPDGSGGRGFDSDGADAGVGDDRGSGGSSDPSGGGALGAAGASTDGDAGSGGSGSSDPTLAEQYPCDGGTAGYDATAIKAGETWTVRRGASTVHTGTDMKAAVEAGINSLSSGRSSQQSVLVQGSGTVAASTRINLASHTLLNVCGTIQITGSGSGDNAALYARDRDDISIPNVTVDGPAVYGLFFRNVDDLHIGQAVVRNTAGIGIRVDNHPSGGSFPKARNIRIDRAQVEDAGGDGIETYGVDGLTIGTLIARSTTNAGLLINNTINANIGLVDAIDTGAGTGYAAFRMANRNGRYADGTYPTNIRVDEVRSLRGGRGIFCVSESGGVEIKKVQIDAAGTDPAIFIEDCYNVRLATEGGTVNRSSAGNNHRIRITARTSGGANGGPQFLGYSTDVILENLTVTNSPISESPCGGNNTVRNNTRIDSSLSVCTGTDKGGN